MNAGPTGKVQNKIVEICAQIFEVLHGNQLVTGSYRKKREQSIQISPTIDNEIDNEEETIFSCPNVVSKEMIFKKLQTDVQRGIRWDR